MFYYYLILKKLKKFFIYQMIFKKEFNSRNATFQFMLENKLLRQNLFVKCSKIYH